MQYCTWLSEKTGRIYSLPDEAQWEKAARGPSGFIYPWGNEWQEGKCNSNPNQVTGVDAFPPQGPYGCYDLLGNVREWTLSLWGERRSEPDPEFLYPWAQDGRNDPRANSLVRRIFRGGATEHLDEMTCTARNAYAPDKPGSPGKRHGFRVVMRI
jgi:formylglycine-generating enzyme required for sulfatase activity